MRTTYRVLAYVVAGAVVWQAAGIAVAMFTVIHQVEDGGVIASGYDWGENVGVLMHRIGGSVVIPLASILLLVFSFFTHVLGAVKWALIVFGLVVLQWVFVFAAFATANAASLHGANALALFSAALWAGRRLTRVDATAASEDQALDRATA